MAGKWWFFVTWQHDERWQPRYTARFGTHEQAVEFAEAQEAPGVYAIEKRWVVGAPQ